MNLKQIRGEVAELINWHWAGDDARIKTYANFRCQEIYNECSRLSIFKKRYQFTTTADTSTYNMPHDFGVPIQLYRVTDETLYPMTLIGEIDVIKNLPAYLDTDSTAEPDSWILGVDQMILVPVPDGAYTVVLSYYAELLELTADASSNVVTEEMPGVIVAGIVADLAAKDGYLEDALYHGNRFKELLLGYINKDWRKRLGAEGIDRRKDKYGAGRIRERGR